MESEKMLEIIEKLSLKDKKMLFEMIKNNSANHFFDILKESIENHSMSFKTMDIKNKKNFLENIYKNEIEKILFISSRNELMKKVNGLKILISGATGTGKTSLVELISKKLPKYELIRISSESLLSPKMGQTQLNIFSLSQKLSNMKNQIIFIDEVDAIISSRYNDRELTESHRITSSFLQFIDSFNSDNIIIFATNLIDKLDPAIYRRMNFKIEGRTINIEEFLNSFLSCTTNNITTQQANMLKDLFNEANFNIADFYGLKYEFEINNSINEIHKDYLIIIKFFNSKANFTKINISERMRDEFKKVGIKCY